MISEIESFARGDVFCGEIYRQKVIWGVWGHAFEEGASNPQDHRENQEP